MPIPKPKSKETENEFVSRCMSNPVMESEYPDKQQRYAVCASSWSDSKPKKTKNNIKQVLVMNQEELKSIAVQNMSALVRKETLDNVEYYVVPVIMATVGIMNNLFYSESELSKFPDAWNGRPVLYNHPEDGSTANRPELKESVELGTVYNSKFEDGKLKAEVWLNIEKCEKVCPVVIHKLQNDEMIEVSTGLFADCIETSGTYNNKQYLGEVINIRPDHLALLPFDKGACSIEDGAGMPRINKDMEKGKDDMSTERKSVFQKVKEMLGFGGTLENRKSFNQIQLDVREAIKDKENLQDNEWLYLEEVYPDSAIYVVERNNKSELKHIPYIIDADGKIQLGSEATPVDMEIVYKRKDDGTIVNNNKSQKGENRMEKETIVNSLIESGKFDEKDREELLTMNESMLSKMLPLVQNEEQEEEKEENSETEESSSKEQEQEETVNNVDEFLSKAPEAIRETLKAGLAKLEAEKSELVQNILKVDGCKFTEEELKSKELDELTAINSLIKPKQDYSGKGGNVDSPVIGNKAKIDDEPLQVPSLV